MKLQDLRFSAFFSVLPLAFPHAQDRNVVADETVQEEGGEADVTEEMAEGQEQPEVKTGPWASCLEFKSLPG